MKRKKAVYLIIACLIVFSICRLSYFFYILYQLNSYYAFIVSFADDVKYEEKDEVGYLTILFRIDADAEREMVLQVMDEDLQDKLADEDPENIIGVSYILDVPPKKLRENHIKRKEIKNCFELLKDNTFDDCLFLDGYSTYTYTYPSSE